MSGINIMSTNGDAININVYGRTYPHLNDKWDGNWLNTKIEIKAGNFIGKTNALLRSDEIERLAKEIEQFLFEKIKEVIFSPIEPWICFKITKNNRQNIELTGEVTDQLGTGNILKFHLEMSPPNLEQIHKRINLVLQEFPAR